MESPPPFEEFVPQQLAALGIEAGEDELAVMQAAHAIYWPGFAALLELDLSGVGPEPEADMSRAPEPA